MSLIDSAPTKLNFRDEVIAGLSTSPRTLPCKFFYDDLGARLFLKICELPEYYVTRTELQILRLHGAEIAATLGENIELIGLGTGAGTKTRILLEELKKPIVYVPIDISKEQLRTSSERFRERFPQLEILPICADYLEPFELPLPRKPSSRSVVYFPGSTIGNFDPTAAENFLRRIIDLAGDDGGLLIGVDLQKDPRIIEAAYNDSQGVTAAFNLNLLVRANSELGADFDLKHWRHRAIYNSEHGRIEMYLISEIAQTVRLQDRHLHFAAGERILTEYSYKHTPAGFAALARKAGFEFRKMWSDDAKLFGVFYFVVAS
ncbi:MAG: L-histidine N(alpha)-methyltransferase [Spartobacteria bacterium]